VTYSIVARDPRTMGTVGRLPSPFYTIHTALEPPGAGPVSATSAITRARTRQRAPNGGASRAEWRETAPAPITRMAIGGRGQGREMSGQGARRERHSSEQGRGRRGQPPRGRRAARRPGGQWPAAVPCPARSPKGQVAEGWDKCRQEEFPVQARRYRRRAPRRHTPLEKGDSGARGPNTASIYPHGRDGHGRPMYAGARALDSWLISTGRRPIVALGGWS
jgi:hypothetical protein